MKKTLHIIVKFCIAAVLIISVIAGYWSEPECIIELTCISNFLLGVIFLFSGIRLLRGKKDYYNIVYSTGTVTILLVFLVCMGSLSGMYHMNFKGAFFFLHVINPIMILMYYVLVINEKKNGSVKYILLTPLAALTYLLIDYIMGTISGQYVYGFFEPEELHIGMAIVVSLVIYIFLLIIGLITYGINCVLPKIKERN